MFPIKYDMRHIKKSFLHKIQDTWNRNVLRILDQEKERKRLNILRISVIDLKEKKRKWKLYKAATSIHTRRYESFFLWQYCMFSYSVDNIYVWVCKKIKEETFICLIKLFPFFVSSRLQKSWNRSSFKWKDIKCIFNL